MNDEVKKFLADISESIKSIFQYIGSDIDFKTMALFGELS